jgi:hypothetical protein
MDLFDKVEEIAMISLSILYNTNPMPLVISTSNLVVDLKQQGCRGRIIGSGYIHSYKKEEKEKEGCLQGCY